MRIKLCFTQICLSVLFVLVLFEHSSVAQVYPKWFLFQGEVSYGKTVVGYANPSFYADSSVSQAILNGCETYAKQMSLKMSGGQTFWSTELGTIWMSANFKEQFDSSAIALAKAQLQPVDTLFSGRLTVVLLGNSDGSGDQSITRKVSIQNLPTPQWTESPPTDNVYHYAVGIAPEYYYEKSSWLQAEYMARRNLARSVMVEIKAQQLMARQFQAIQQEQFAAVLNNIQTIARWRDVKKRMFFVLIRMVR